MLGTAGRDHFTYFLLSYSPPPGGWPLISDSKIYCQKRYKPRDTGKLLKSHAVIKLISIPVHHYIIGKCLPGQGHSDLQVNIQSFQVPKAVMVLANI